MESVAEGGRAVRSGVAGVRRPQRIQGRAERYVSALPARGDARHGSSVDELFLAMRTHN